jgi:hypothetical protein
MKSLTLTLIGPIRFYPWFDMWDWMLTMAGHTVFTHSVRPGWHPEVTPEQKALLDAAVLRKIKASDGIVVLNKFAYMGESTQQAMKQASHERKTIWMLESWSKGVGVSIRANEPMRRTLGRLIPEAKPDRGLLTRSPVDTFEYPPPWDLLGDSGSLRTGLVKEYETFEENQGITTSAYLIFRDQRPHAVES